MNLDDFMKEIEKDDDFADRFYDKKCGCHDDKDDKDHCDHDRKHDKYDDKDDKDRDWYFDDDYDEFDKVDDWDYDMHFDDKDHDWDFDKDHDDKDHDWDFDKDHDDKDHDDKDKCDPKDFEKKISLVEILADTIKFKDKQIDKDIQTIKLRASIKKIICCDAKLIDAKVFHFPKKKGLIVVVRYRLTIEFINHCKEKSFLQRVFEFKKFIPFPRKKHCKDFDFDSLKPKVFVKKIKCVDVIVKESCGCDIVCLKPVVLLEILTVLTKKAPIKTINVKRKLKRKY